MTSRKMGIRGAIFGASLCVGLAVVPAVVLGTRGRARSDSRPGDDEAFSEVAGHHHLKLGKFEPYWANTGGTRLIETLALKQGMALSDKSTLLLNDGSIDTIVNPHIVLRYIDQNPEAFWNFFFSPDT